MSVMSLVLAGQPVLDQWPRTAHLQAADDIVNVLVQSWVATLVHSHAVQALPLEELWLVQLTKVQHLQISS